MFKYMWFDIQIIEAAASQTWNNTSRSLKKRATGPSDEDEVRDWPQPRQYERWYGPQSYSYWPLPQTSDEHKSWPQPWKGQYWQQTKRCVEESMVATIWWEVIQQVTDGRRQRRCGGINGRNHMMNLPKIAPRQIHVGHGRKSQPPAPLLRQHLQTYWKQSSRTNTGPMSCS